MADLIYSRRRDAQEMSYDEIQQRAPAVFTATKHSELSDRYETVDTLDAIRVLKGYDYVPVQAAQKRSRKAGESAYADHMVAFSHRFNLLDSDRPEIILYNSHNGKSSMKMYAGLFRAVCSNGLVAGEGYEARMRHLKASISDVGNMLEDTAAKLPELSDKIKRMKSITLKRDDIIDLAYSAASLRWERLPDFNLTEDRKPGVYFDEVTAASLVRTRRFSDVSTDLWTTFNKMQEGMIRGGVKVMSVSDDRWFGKHRFSRPIGSVGESVRINRGLWDIADNFMKEVA